MFKIESKGVISKTIKFLEKILAVLVIIGVLIYAIYSFPFFFDADWSKFDTFYQLIYRVLLITIGLELSRMLVTHSFIAILELLAFVVARKMLKPDIETLEIFLGVIAFTALLAAHHFFIIPHRIKSKSSEKNIPD